MAPSTEEADAHQALIDQLDIHAIPKPFRNHHWKPNQRRNKNIKTILDHQGLAWTDVVKVTKYLTDMRDMDGMVAVLAQYFGAWTPASTTVCVNQLSTPGARVELDMIAVYPQQK